MSDYENYDNLAFEPKMTWEELKEFASKNETYKEHPNDNFFMLGRDLYFYKNGAVSTCDYVLAENRTPEQMKAIIENLFGENR